MNRGKKTLFLGKSDDPAPVTVALAKMLVRVFGLIGNSVAVNGHIRAQPEVLRVNPVWDLSAARAMRMRVLLEQEGLVAARIQRVTGYADRMPTLRNPMALRNNRLEIILLRKGR